MNIDKNTLTGIIIIIVILIIWYFSSKNNKNGNPDDYDVPTDGNTTPSELDEAEIKRISSQLYDDLKGAQFFENFNGDMWEEFAGTSDTLFVAIVNKWNEDHYDWKDQTLIQRIDKKRASIGWTFTHNKIKRLMDVILEKAERLNIR